MRQQLGRFAFTGVPAAIRRLPVPLLDRGGSTQLKIPHRSED